MKYSLKILNIIFIFLIILSISCKKKTPKEPIEDTPTPVWSTSPASKHIEAGIQLQEKGELEEALKKYQKALKIDPNIAQTYHLIGNIYYALQNPQEALWSYQQALILNPNIAEVHYDLGNLYFDLGEYSIAIEHYKQALTLDASFTEIYYNLALALEHNEEYKEAIKYYQKFIDNASEEYKVMKENAIQNIIMLQAR